MIPFSGVWIEDKIEGIGTPFQEDGVVPLAMPSLCAYFGFCRIAAPFRPMVATMDETPPCVILERNTALLVAEGTRPAAFVLNWRDSFSANRKLNPRGRRGSLETCDVEQVLVLLLFFAHGTWSTGAGSRPVRGTFVQCRRPSSQIPPRDR